MQLIKKTAIAVMCLAGITTAAPLTVNAAEQETVYCYTETGEDVTIYGEQSGTWAEIATINSGTVITAQDIVMGADGNQYVQVDVENVGAGYIAADNTLTEEELAAARLAKKELYICVEPDAESNIKVTPQKIAVAEGNAAVNTTDTTGYLVTGMYASEDKTYICFLYEGGSAFISSEYATLLYGAPTAQPVVSVKPGQQVADFALRYVGYPYVWGGESLTEGCDCSGYVMLVYGEFGYDLPHYSAAQAEYGTSVSIEELQPGDLVFYSRGDYAIGHVAIYIGDGQVVQAASEEYGILVTSLTWSGSVVCCRRLVE